MSVSKTQVTAVHMECVRNRSSDFNRFVLDGCMLYEPGNEMACAACGCHRNFHRRVAVDLPAPVVIDNRAQSESSQNSSTARAASPEPAATNRFQLSPASPATRDTSDVPAVARDASPAERRTRVTKEQIVMLKEVMDRNEWKMFRFYSREEVEKICSEIGIGRMTLKNWICKLRRELRDNNKAARD